MRIHVDMCRMWDPELHKDPDQWEGNRFLKFRTKDEKGPLAQLASTSPDHLAFGHGSQACPGRFFAASVLKVALSHLLLKYDWNLAPGTSTTPVMFGIASVASPTAKLLIRRRNTTELDIDAI